MTQIRLKVPKTAKKNEIIELKARIQHDMESGYRLTQRGDRIPRKILTQFECLYNDDIVFQADFGPGMAANPLLSFYMRVQDSGDIIFRWIEQGGEVFSKTARLNVS